MPWEKVKVSDLVEGDTVKVCGIAVTGWRWSLDLLGKPLCIFNNDIGEFAQLPPDATVKRKVTKPKPKRYIVEFRPPKKGERFLSHWANGLTTAGEDWKTDIRAVIVEEL